MPAASATSVALQAEALTAVDAAGPVVALLVVVVEGRTVVLLDGAELVVPEEVSDDADETAAVRPTLHALIVIARVAATAIAAGVPITVSFHDPAGIGDGPEPSTLLMTARAEPLEKWVRPAPTKFLG